MCGITLQTYARYCADNNLPPATVVGLRHLSDAEWLEIFLAYYWKPCKADLIHSTWLAYVLVDWYWHFGKVAVRELQMLVGAMPDGIMGAQTLHCIGLYNARPLALSLLEMRKLYLLRLCNQNRDLQVFRRGWLNRIAALYQYLQLL